MTEAERLQKIVHTQEKELLRLRRLLSVARIAHGEFQVEGGTLMVTVSVIGVDEYHFLEKCKPELESIATAILGARASVKGPPTDSITGDKLEGGVAPK